MLNNKGVTLVEMMIVMVILGIIGAIAYPILFMNEKITTSQIEESATRNEIRSLENFLKTDLRNSSAFIKTGTNLDYIYTITSSSGDLINYKKEGGGYISRVISRGPGSSEVIEFQEIKDIEIRNPDNENLIDVKITSTDEKGDSYIHELKIARWQWKVKKDTVLGDYVNFIVNESLVMGSFLEFNNSINIKASESGSVGSILLKDNLHVNKKAEIEGNLFIGKNGELNAKTEIKGDLSVGENLNINKEGDIEGNISVGNNFEINHKTEIEGDISVGQDFHINKEGDIEGNISVGNNLMINHKTEIDGNISVGQNLNINKKADIEGSVSVGGNVEINDEAKIDGNLYVVGNLRINKEVEVEGDIYVAGNLTINGEEDIKGKVYYGGTLQPSEYRTDSRFIKKDAQFFSEEIIIEPVVIAPIPEAILPEPREMSWYTSKGYKEQGSLGVDPKIVSQWGYSDTYSGGSELNLVIVALDGDINIDLKNQTFSGLLYAPNGAINIRNTSEFIGLVISKDKFSYNKNNFEITFKSLAEFTGPGNLFATSDDYPFKLE